jgi:stress response protein YsnF
LIVVSAMQIKQGEIQKLQAEELDAMRAMLQMVREGTEHHERRLREHDQQMREHDERMKNHDERMKTLDIRIEKLVSAIGAFIAGQKTP